MVEDVGMEEYHRHNWLRTPDTETCGEPWMPSPSLKAHGDDDSLENVTTKLPLLLLIFKSILSSFTLTLKHTGVGS